jgi:hypothetical protein
MPPELASNDRLSRSKPILYGVVAVILLGMISEFISIAVLGVN